jgi:hypothetical protein
MKNKNERDKLFDDQLGGSVGRAVIEHHEIPNDEYTKELRGVLADIGADLQRTKKVPEGMEYQGSFSVHVYASPVLRTFAFAGVNNPQDCHYKLADAALKKLREDVEEYYSGTRRKLRSGF